jgi:hypothetical protein
MELSDSTLQVLKNYASINSNLVVEEGNTLQTISEAKNVLSKSTISEVFPSRFGIYDLNEFLNVLGLVDRPRLKFEDNSVLIGDSTGRSKVRYYFSDTEMLTAPSKEVKMPDTDVRFSLDNDTLNKIKRAASALGHNELQVSPSGGVVSLTVTSTENSTANSFSIDVEGSANIDKYNFIFNISNLKMTPGNYEVEISSKLISKFTNTETDLKYWIALEKTSTYGE